MNGEMFVDRFGDAGAVVLFVHGIGGTGNVWGAQVATLAGSFRLLVPDLPGCGRSATVDGIDAAGYVDALVALLEHERAERVHVVGHSFGSNLCQRLALARPDLVASLAIVGGGPGGATPPQPHPLARRAERVRADGLVGVADETVATALAPQTRASRPVVGSFVREMVMGSDPAGYAAMCDAAATAPAFDSGAIAVRTLLVTGVHDVVTPPSAARALDAVLPHSSLSIVTEAGHWPQVERPRAVSALLANHLLGPPD